MSDVLSKTSAHDVSAVLQASLKTATPEEVGVISKLLRPLIGRALVKKTCVRCDKEYIESENDGHACRVEHCAAPEAYFDPNSEWPDDASEGPPELIIYPCCEEVFEVDGFRYNRDECYTTMHTTDPNKIDFNGYEARLEKKRAGMLPVAGRASDVRPIIQL
jgi:hypothetical protein